jgi:hypothetical protein
MWQSRICRALRKIPTISIFFPMDVEIPHPGTPVVFMHLEDKDSITVPFVQDTLEVFSITDDVFKLEFGKSAILILPREGSQPPHPYDPLFDILSQYSSSNFIHQKANPADKWLECPFF